MLNGKGHKTVMLDTKECMTDEKCMLEVIKTAWKFSEEDVFEIVRLAEGFARENNSPETARLLDNVRREAKFIILMRLVLDVLGTRKPETEDTDEQ